jgi:tripartite-type tricarboxylate transporter receptor subunit TctC
MQTPDRIVEQSFRPLRRQLLAALALSPLAAFAQQPPGRWPERAIRLLVGWPPGGSADVVARLLAEPLGRRLGQPVVVENRPGASGRIAAQQVAQAQPDGYTLLFGAPSELTISAATVRTLPYDLQRSFQPVTQVVSGAFMLVADPKFDAGSVEALVAYGRAHPGRLNFASFGNNTTNHIYGAQFCDAAGIEALHVPYKGGAPAWNDLMAGQVQFMFDNAAVVMPLVRAGKMKALAVLSPERIRLAPDVPTMAEAGYPDIGMRSWLGLLAPAGTPAAVVGRLQAEVAAVLTAPEFARTLEERGMPANPSTPAAFARVLQTETATLRQLVQRLGLQLE